jgi:phosphatidylcholine synthase
LKQSIDLPSVTFRQRFAGWLVHAFTASGAYVGVLALYAISEKQFLSALWLMLIAILIDAVDGLFARMIDIKAAVPKINGELLDNIVDFCNYTIVPSFFLLVTKLVPAGWGLPCVMVIVLSSAYQFTQEDAKTSDHFFKGFPSYWNIAVFYLFFWQMETVTNLWILLILAVLSFVPIKYVYPSRLEYLADSDLLRVAMLFATIAWGVATAGLLWIYPASNKLLVSISMGYMILYVAISLYRTWFPLLIARRGSIG